MRTPPGLRLLAAALAGQRRTLVRAAGWSAIEGLPTLLSGLLVARALRSGFLQGSVPTGLAWLGLWLAAAAVAAFATTRLYPLLADVVEPARDTLVRGVVSGTLSRAVAGSTAPAGSLASAGGGVAQAVQQVDTVRNLLSAILRSLRQIAIPIVTAALGLLVLSPRMALLVLPWVAVAVAGYALLLPRMLAAEQSLVTAETALATEAATCVAGLRDITAGGASAWASARLERHVEAACAANRRAGRVAAGRHAVVALGAVGPLITIAVAAAVWVPQGEVTLPVVLGALTYVQTGLAVAVRSAVHAGSSWLLQLSVNLAQLARGSAPAPREAATSERSPGRAARVELDDVTFAYGPHSEPVVRNLSLTVEEGEHLAVIGMSGAGKSTLSLLLAGALTPQRGSLMVAGRTPRPDPSSDVVVVPQEAYVFAGSLRENLVYLRPGAGDNDVMDAVRAVGLWPLVERMGGLDATLGTGGAGLSGGERQRIALARTLVAQAGVVVLDEATSRLEPAAEAAVEEAFRATGATLVVIAHRLDAARRADRVLLLDGSRWLVDEHPAVLDRSDLYRRLSGEQRRARAAAD